MKHVAVFPFAVLAVIVVEPTFLAVTYPQLLTLATDESLEDQVTVLLLALAGSTVADISAESPTSSVTLLSERYISVGI